MRYHTGMREGLIAGLLVLAAAHQQPIPQPFPRPGEPGRPPTATPPAVPVPAGEAAEPTRGSLGLPIYPAATYLTSFDAGMGQRFYLFGTNASFNEIVTYYKTYLKERGSIVFDAPATHMFDIGRFRQESMAFPPGITVKDYTWNGSEGYLHVRAGTAPVRYRTIIQLVPPPPGAAR
ncbi:MAG: hypothetical protein LC804_08760 [Acidobacteria bacterium]|nr:hypothetical protein [Acidobacteriota bacterium]